MNPANIVTTIIFFTLSYYAMATNSSGESSGHIIGNGGDLVYCHPSASNSFKGYYTLDFLQTLTTDTELIDSSRWNQYTGKILTRLRRLDPQLAVQFYNYLTRFKKHRKRTGIKDLSRW